MLLPRGYVDQKPIRDGIDRVARQLSPLVVRIRYDVGEDWSGEPSIFFRILLSDAASREEVAYANAKHIEAALLNEVRPDELGLQQAYFNFRSESEQRQIKEPAWA